MNKHINISFFKQPKICSNLKHKINFENKNDKYNPFSIINNIYKSSLYLNNKDILSIENALYECFVKTQLNECYNEKPCFLKNSYFKLNKVIYMALISFLNSFASKEKILLKTTLKSKKYPCLFCIIYLLFADVGIQIFFSSFKDSYVVSFIHIMFINMHEIKIP